MPKKGGLLSVVTAVAVGAAAIFLSKKENRTKTKKVANAVAKRVKAEYKKVPVKVKEEVKARLKIAGKQVAVMALQKAKTSAKKSVSAPTKAKKKK